MSPLGYGLEEILHRYPWIYFRPTDDTYRFDSVGALPYSWPVLKQLASRVKPLLKGLRDDPRLNPILLYPFVRLRERGVRLPRHVYQHLPYQGPFTVPVPGGRSLRMISDGSALENNAFWSGGLGGHEAECYELWLRLARDATLVLDIGANTGSYSLLAAAVAPAARVHAFEPLARIAAMMTANVNLNPGFAIEVHALAVSDRVGTATIHDPGGKNVYSASLEADFLETQGVSYPVTTTTIDAFLAERNQPKVDLIKLDVEGHEAAVFAGMRATLLRMRPPVLFEYLPQCVRPALQAELRALLAAGYRFFTIGADGVHPSPEPTPSDDSWNALLMPRELCARYDLPG